MPSLFELPLAAGSAPAPPPPAAVELAGYHVIVVNSSAGKDSQAMLDLVVERADAEGVRDRLVVLHCDLGLSPKGHEIEWPGTVELAREHAAHYGLRFVVVRRGVRGFLEQVDYRGRWMAAKQRYCTDRYKAQPGRKAVTALAREVASALGAPGKVRAQGFLEQVEERGRWSSQGQRLCTSNNKREPANQAVTRLADEARAAARATPRILQCFGFRAEESPRRRKMPSFSTDKRTTSGRKTVHVWLPIQDWTAAQVWGRIAAAGTRPHPAYALGMTRLSCRFCIFAPKSQLLLSARLNPGLFAEYLELERRIGHKFRADLSLADVQAALEAGEAVLPDDGAWGM
jgi:3'-phosphoadenosine 5'-phosphosulfate sulfotransferase (PAPS reductase)/FAD synthetase